MPLGAFHILQMVDLVEEVSVLMQQYLEDILNTSLVSTSEVKDTRTKLIEKTTPESEGFMMMLKRFTNLLCVLLSSSCPLYKTVYAIIKELR